MYSTQKVRPECESERQIVSHLVKIFTLESQGEIVSIEPLRYHRYVHLCMSNHNWTAFATLVQTQKGDSKRQPGSLRCSRVRQSVIQTATKTGRNENNHTGPNLCLNCAVHNEPTSTRDKKRQLPAPLVCMIRNVQNRLSLLTASHLSPFDVAIVYDSSDKHTLQACPLTVQIFVRTECQSYKWCDPCRQKEVVSFSVTSLSFACAGTCACAHGASAPAGTLSNSNLYSSSSGTLPLPRSCNTEKQHKKQSCSHSRSS